MAGRQQRRVSVGRIAQIATRRPIARTQAQVAVVLQRRGILLPDTAICTLRVPGGPMLPRDLSEGLMLAGGALSSWSMAVPFACACGLIAYCILTYSQ